jgi:hypothetical protein
VQRNNDNHYGFFKTESCQRMMKPFQYVVSNGVTIGSSGKRCPPVQKALVPEETLSTCAEGIRSSGKAAHLCGKHWFQRKSCPPVRKALVPAEKLPTCAESIGSRGNAAHLCGKPWFQQKRCPPVRKD